MNTVSLRIDDEFEWCGSTFYVHDFEPPYILIFKEDGERKINKVRYLSIVMDPTFQVNSKDKRQMKKTENKQDNNRRALLDTLPKERSERAHNRYSMISPILLYDDAKSGNMYAAQSFNEKYQCYLTQKETLEKLKRKQLIERIADRVEYSVRQIQRYLADYKKTESVRENHGIEGLVSKAHLDSHDRKDETAIQVVHPKKPELVLDTIYIRIDKLYAPILIRELGIFLAKRRRKINQLHEAIEISCTAEKLAPLSYDTIYKIVDRIDKYVLERINKGDIVDPQLIKEKASNQFAHAPLHVIEIDHVQLPITLIDPETGVVLGEPWLTVAMCVYTRMVWGLDLSFEEPSGHKVMRTLFNGICFKKAKERYGTINDWEMHGIPSVILMDNGSDFKSAYVKAMIEDVLKAEPRYRPIATPRYGGVIERNFGSINTKFLQNLLGVREKSSPDREDRAEAKLEAILTLDNLRELFINYITDVYHHSEHSGLPLDCNTPTARLYTAMDVMGNLPFIRESDEEHYLIQLMPSAMKSYRRDGIRLENVKYGSQETSRFISNKIKKNCKIKFDQEDISRIYLLDPSSKQYIEVPSISPPADEIKGMSRKMYNMIRKILIEKGRLTKQQIPGSAKISEGKLLIKEKYDKMVKTNTPIRRTALKQGFQFKVIDPKSHQTESTPISKVDQMISNLDQQLERLRAEE